MTTRDTTAEPYGVGYSLLRTIITPYWLYTGFQGSFVIIGMTLAAIEHGWRWDLWWLAMIGLWLGDQGVKAIDLAAEDIAIRYDSNIMFYGGLVEGAIGLLIGIYLASITSWWLLTILFTAGFLSLAYDLEWFEGRLHDRKYVTGWGNLAFTTGWLPTVGGYFLLAETLTPGIAIFAIGPMLISGGVTYYEEDIKAELYEIVGIEYTRSVPSDIARLKRRIVKANFLYSLGCIAMAVGLVVEFVL